MKQEKCFENYPFWMVLVSNIVTLLVYLIGAFIIFKVGLIWTVLYLLFVGVLEFRLISGHCVNCYYYGKTCAFGKGRLCSFLFKKGNSKKFLNLKITWKDILPDFMVSIVPSIVGIVLLILNFDWLLLALIVLLLALTFIGNAFVRSSLACKYCKQKKLGCPAQKLFEKKDTN
ncbi:MAG: hypothetical protein WC462_05020 [archaeon]